MHLRRHAAFILASLLALGMVGCARSEGTEPLDAGAAVALVLSQDDRFAGIGPRDDGLIGQASWYEVASADSGWRVTVRIGWGDCPAGCISERRWTYEVDPASRDVRLVDELGDPLPGSSGVGGLVLAGPTCPVESASPDPSCAARTVAGAVMVVLRDGDEVARVSSTGDGSFWIDLAPGAYRLVPQPVEGLMGTPAALDVRVEADGNADELTIAYDTGIR